MPITDLDGRWRPQRLGKVRLGRTEEKKIKGKIHNIPYATEYFVMDDMPEAIREEYGPEPTTLRIEFLFASIPDVFPHFHKYYLRRGLRCLGDGNIVLYRVAGTLKDPVVCIRDAVISADIADEWLEQWAGEYGTTNPMGNSFACLGFECPSSEPGKCRPKGRLLFAMQGHESLGYHEMATGSINAIKGIVGQFLLALNIFGHIDAIPWNLHLRPETVQAAGKSRKIYVPWIEIDPSWLQRHHRIRGLHLRAVEEKKRADIADLYGREDVADLDHDQTPQALLEAAREQEGEEAPPVPGQEAIEKAQAVLEEAMQPEEPPDAESPVAPPEGEPEDGSPEVTTERGNIYERLLKDTNHNLQKRGYEGRYAGIEEIRQAMDEGGIKGRLSKEKYLDYLTIVIDVKERNG